LIIKGYNTFNGNVNRLKEGNKITKFINERSELIIDKKKKPFNKKYKYCIDLKTKEITEKGFSYLQNLSKKLKISQKQKKCKFNFDEMAKAICQNESPFIDNINNNKIKKENLADINSLNNEISNIEKSISIASLKEEKNYLNILPEDEINTRFSLNYDLKQKIRDQALKIRNIRSLNIKDKNLDLNRNSITTLNNRLFEENPNLIKLIECENFLKMNSNDLTLNVSHSNNKIDSIIPSESLLNKSFEVRNVSNTDSNDNINISNKDNSNYRKSICDVLNENINSSNKIPTSESFKSSKGYSFKIQLKCIEENKSKSFISIQDENDYFDDKEINSNNCEYQNLKFKKHRNFSEGNIHFLNRKSVFHLTSFEDLNKIIDKKNLYQKNILNFCNQNINLKHFLESKKSKSFSINSNFKKLAESSSKNNSKSSSHYFEDSNFTPSFYNINDNDPFSERGEIKKKIVNDYNNKLKKIDFIDRKEIYKKKIIQSIHTSPYIKSEKIQNEEFSNLNEKTGQFNIIKLFSIDDKECEKDVFLKKDIIQKDESNYFQNQNNKNFFLKENESQIFHEKIEIFNDLSWANDKTNIQNIINSKIQENDFENEESFMVKNKKHLGKKSNKNIIIIQKNPSPDIQKNIKDFELKLYDSNINQEVRNYSNTFPKKNLYLNKKDLINNFNCEENLNRNNSIENKNKQYKLLFENKYNQENACDKAIKLESEEKISYTNKINFIDHAYIDKKNRLYLNFYKEYDNDVKKKWEDYNFKNYIDNNYNTLDSSKILMNEINSNSNDSSININLNRIKLENENVVEIKPEKLDFKINLFEC